MDKPIAIFDSGIGGLTVMKEVMKAMPDENVIYFGDTARVPYGIKSGETVKRFALENCRFLMRFDPKHIIVACNTASSVALEYLSENMDVEVSGVILPGALAAVETEAKKIGVIGTETTIKSGAYRKSILKLRKDVAVFSESCPLLVPIVEEGWPENHVVVKGAIDTYLSRFDDKGIEALILGCTHYPLLKEAIKTRLGAKVRVVDSAQETARILARELIKNGGERKGATSAQRRFLVTDNPERFAAIGSRVLGEKLDAVGLVSPEEFFEEGGDEE